MKNQSIILAVLALLLLAASCDKIEDPLKPVTITGGGKTVLIKDFTGAMCVNCPAAAEYAHNLQHQLGEEHIIILGVHAGPLATPAGQFPNFLTEEGDTWYGNHDSNPLFSVDHAALTEGNTLYVEQIDAPVSEALGEQQTFEVYIEPTYNDESRQLTVTTNVEALADMAGQYYVTVCLVEDSIVGWQKVPGGLDREYVFRNVFRGTLNGAAGQVFKSGDVEAFDDVSYDNNIELDSTFNADQCYILSYVYDKSQDGKILQTAIEKIK